MRIQATSNTSNQVEAAKIERIYATNGESYKHGNWDLNPDAHRWIKEHDCEHRLVSQSVSSIKIRHPAPSGGYFKSYELKKSIKLNSQAAKEDKQLSEAKQQALNLARIGIHIEELSRSFAQISTPNESKVNIVAEEINGSAQDLLRLAFSYAHKWRTSRRIGVAQSSGYDKDTAVSVPEGENPEAQYLFHPKTLEQMDSSRQTARNDRLLRTAITNRQPTNYYRPPSSPYTSRGGSPAYRGSFNNRGGYYRPSYSQNNGYRPQFNSNYRPNRPAGYTPNTSTGFQRGQRKD
ncbi:hypothetical protein BB559_002227 [Furculomyces boomerangus]|uniref:Uncharacterized protein n=1 Tax=Furculomyces boomerangus TaxID=61424 RepID=A0A2T9YX28_9FUNG|nr:hypothetical protein BB559_002227 [Furculomyces boomerangus]